MRAGWTPKRRPRLARPAHAGSMSAQQLAKRERIRERMAERGVVEDAPAFANARGWTRQPTRDARERFAAVGVVIHPRRAVQADIFDRVIATGRRGARHARRIRRGARDATLAKFRFDPRAEPGRMT